tara:strand:- start:1483 stop:1731 length:249 start_codon:yes stop_codon:yes gene_type:complete
MELKIGNDQGRIVIDDTTGKIMFVLVKNAVEGKSDCIATTSFTNHHDGTHTSLRDAPNWDEEESNRRMNIIGQNGNTGEHYD